MSHFEAAGYRILSFKYDPTKINKDDKRQDRDANVHVQDDLPSLESLKMSLDEIQQGALAEPSTLVSASATLSTSGSKSEAEIGESSLPSSNTAAHEKPACLTNKFHLFGDLPAEIRIKIWSMTFLPRVVELRPTRPNYAPGRTDYRKTQWQSGCTNPAALSVNSESRELALAHFRIPFPLARITTTTTSASPNSEGNRREKRDADSDESLSDVFGGVAASYWGSFSFNSSGKAKLLKRTLYVAPEHDTVVTLGLDSDLIRLKSMIDTFREEDPFDEGIRRLGFSVRDWGYGGSAVMLKGLERSFLKELNQLVLFMYSEPHPPNVFCEKGAAASLDWLEQYRETGNICELIPCEGSSAWNAYKMWSGTRGRQFWDDDGNIMKIGRAGNDVEIMDLVFKDGW